jgi:hypothetical protein
MGVSQGKYPEIAEKIRKNRSTPTNRGQPHKKEISRATAGNCICIETAQPPAMMQAAVYANDYDR